MKILFVAQETAPYYRSGGLADIVYGLSRALCIKGHDVRVIVPRYRTAMKEANDMHCVLTGLNVPMGSYSRVADLWKIESQPKFYFVDQNFYFGRNDYYGYLDDYERFIFLSRFALEMLVSDEFQKCEGSWFPKIIQGFDWNANLIPGWLPLYRARDKRFKSARYILFIHNPRRLGKFSSRALLLAEQEPAGFYPQVSETPIQVNLLGRGMLFADKVITVNPDYSKPENPLPASAQVLGAVMDERFKEKSFVGIPSGIDEEAYNPATDPAIKRAGALRYQNFKPVEIDKRGKNKLALQKEFGFEQNPGIPLLGMVGRLIPENGFDILPALNTYRDSLGDFQLIILAEPGDVDYKGIIQQWETSQDHQHPWIKSHLSFDDTLVRRIYAGCDLLLIPAKELPNSIYQLIAMRYGAIPVARHTGALCNTIVDYQDGIKPRLYSGKGMGIGFKFEEFSETAFLQALKRALGVYRDQPEIWRNLQLFNMQERYGWELPAEEYFDIYKDVLNTPQEDIPKGQPLKLEARDRLLQALQEIGNLPGLGRRSSQDILKQAARLVRWVLDCDAVFVRGLEKRLQLAAEVTQPSEIDIVERSLKINHRPPIDDAKITAMLSQSANNIWKHLGDVDREGICQIIGGLNAEIAVHQGWKAGWSTPILVHGRLLGWIDTLYTTVPNDPPWVISTLTMLANTFGLRLDTIRLSAEADQISDMSNDILQTRSVEEVVTQVYQWVRRLIPGSFTWLCNVKDGKLDIKNGKPDNPLSPSVEVKYFQRLAERVLRHRLAEYRADWIDAPRGKDHRRLYRSILVVPIAPEANVKPAAVDKLLFVASQQRGAFTRDDEQILTRHLAPQVHAALQRARWLEERDDSRAAQFIKLADSLVAGSLDPRTLMDNIVTTISEVLHVDAATLFLSDDDYTRLDIKAAYGYQNPLLEAKAFYKWGEGVTGRIAETNQPFQANDLDTLREKGKSPEGKYDYLYGGKRPASFYGLPLNVSGQEKAIGVLKVESITPRPFTSEDVSLIKMMGSVIATVVYNTQQSEARLNKLSANLDELSRSLAGSLDPQTLMDNIVTTISEVLHVDAATLFLSDDNHTRLDIKAAYGYQEPLLDVKAFYKWGEGVTGRIAETNQPFQANDLDTLREKGKSPEGKYDYLYGGKRPASFYGLPLNVSGQEKAIGVLKVESITPRPFTSEDVLLIKMMGSVIATVVYNAQQSEARSNKLSANLDRLSRSLAGSLDPQALMANIVTNISEVLHVDAATLFLSDDNHTRLDIKAAYGYQEPLLEAKAFYKWGEGVTGRIAQTNDAFQANDLDTLREKGKSPEGKYDYLYGGKRPASFYGLPLNVSGQEKAIGVLKVESITPRPFTSEDVLLIKMMGSVIATVVYNAQQSEARLNKLSANLDRLSRSLAGSLDPRTLMDNIVTTISEVLHVDAATLFLSNEDYSRLIVQAAYGYQKPLLDVKAFYKWGEGVTGRIAQTKDAFQANDLDTLREKGKSPEGKYDYLYGGKRPASFYGLPLDVSGQEKAIGVLKVESITPRPFTSEDVSLIKMMGSVIATVVYNAQLDQARLVDFAGHLGSLVFPNPQAPQEMLRHFACSKDAYLRDVLARSLSLLVGEDLERAYQEALALLQLGADPEVYSRLAEVTSGPIRSYFDLLDAAVHTEKVQPARLASLFELSYRWSVLYCGAEQPDCFQKSAHDFVEAFARECNAQIEHQAAQGNWEGFLLNTEHTFEGTYLPKTLVVALHRSGNLVSEENPDDLRALLTALPWVVRDNNAAVIPVRGSREEIDRTRLILRNKLQQPHAIDSILLEIEDIRKIIGTDRPEIALQRHVLSRIRLEKIVPYKQEGPTGDLFFFGREPEMARICSGIKEANSNYAIIGTRRIGKTSLLRQLYLYRLPGMGFRTIQLEGASYDSLASFRAGKIITWRPEPPANSPETIGDLLDGNIPGDLPLVLLLDEADKLIKIDEKFLVIHKLRALSNANLIHVVLCGERTLNESLHAADTPLFNLVDKIILGPLNIEAVSALVVKPMERLEIRLTDEHSIVKKIYEFTFGHPNIVQRLCLRLIEYLDKMDLREITPGIVGQIIQTPQFIENDFLETYFAKASVLEHICVFVMAADPQARTLTSIDKGVRAHHIDTSLNQVKAALDRLVELRGILCRPSQETYEFQVTAIPVIVAKSKRLNDWIALRREIFVHAGDIAPEDAPPELKGRPW